MMYMDFGNIQQGSYCTRPTKPPIKRYMYSTRDRKEIKQLNLIRHKSGIAFLSFSKLRHTSARKRKTITWNSYTYINSTISDDINELVSLNLTGIDCSFPFLLPSPFAWNHSRTNRVFVMVLSVCRPLTCQTTYITPPTAESVVSTTTKTRFLPRDKIEDLIFSTFEGIKSHETMRCKRRSVDPINPTRRGRAHRRQWVSPHLRRSNLRYKKKAKSGQIGLSPNQNPAMYISYKK